MELDLVRMSTHNLLELDDPTVCKGINMSTYVYV